MHYLKFAPYLVLLPSILLLFYLKSSTTTSDKAGKFEIKLLHYLLVASVYTLITGFVAFSGNTNLYLLYLYLPIETFLIGRFCYPENNYKTWKIIPPIAVLLSVLVEYYLYSTEVFPSISIFIESFLLLPCLLHSANIHLQKADHISQGRYLIIISILIFNSCTIIIYLFSRFIQLNMFSFLKDVWIVMDISNVVCYLLMTYGVFLIFSDTSDRNDMPLNRL